MCGIPVRTGHCVSSCCALPCTLLQPAARTMWGPCMVTLTLPFGGNLQGFRSGMYGASKEAKHTCGSCSTGDSLQHGNPHPYDGPPLEGPAPLMPFSPRSRTWPGRLLPAVPAWATQVAGAGEAGAQCLPAAPCRADASSGLPAGSHTPRRLGPVQSAILSHTSPTAQTLPAVVPAATARHSLNRPLTCFTLLHSTRAARLPTLVACQATGPSRLRALGGIAASAAAGGSSSCSSP